MMRNVFAFALLPVVVTVGAIVARRSTLVSAILGLGAALVVAALAFPTDAARWQQAAGQWVPVLLEVMVIIFGGLLLAQAMTATGRQDRIARWVGAALGTGPGAALAVVHGVAPFAEAVTGFGIGVTLAIPLLIGCGFSSRTAAAVGLLGLCAVPWGSMGPGVLIAAHLGGLGYQQLGVATAVANGPVFLVVGVVVALLTAAPGGRARAVLAALGSGAVLWGAVLVTNLLIGTAVAGALGALITFAVHLLVHRLRGAQLRGDAALLRAVVPYAVLLGGVLVMTAALGALGLDGTGWHLLASPALWLVLAVLVTTPAAHRGPTLAAAAGRWLQVGPANGLLMLLGIVMATSGMAGALAAAASHLGSAYALVVAPVGALGGYLTGSNSSANAMFAAPQAQVAQLVGIPTLWAVAVQNSSAGIFLMPSPAKIELAAQLCPDPVEARRALRPVLGAALAALVLLMGALTLAQLLGGGSGAVAS
jgi:lactate permease